MFPQQKKSKVQLQLNIQAYVCSVWEWRASAPRVTCHTSPHAKAHFTEAVSAGQNRGILNKLLIWYLKRKGFGCIMSSLVLKVPLSNPRLLYKAQSTPSAPLLLCHSQWPCPVNPERQKPSLVWKLQSWSCNMTQETFGRGGHCQEKLISWATLVAMLIP